MFWKKSVFHVIFAITFYKVITTTEGQTGKNWQYWFIFSNCIREISVNEMKHCNKNDNHSPSGNSLGPPILNNFNWKWPFLKEIYHLSKKIIYNPVKTYNILMKSKVSESLCSPDAISEKNGWFLFWVRPILAPSFRE